MRHVFARLKLKKKVPRPKSPQASDEEQTAWKKGGLTERLREAGLTLYWTWTDDMKSFSIAPVVRKWEIEGLDAVVWDGAPGHRGSAFASR
jgi:hypothetical protein